MHPSIELHLYLFDLQFFIYMKRLFLVILLLVTSLSIQAQDFSKISKIRFISKSDYKKYEPQAKACAAYILSKPIDKNDANRYKAISFSLVWMEGTPDYQFTIEEEQMQLTKNSQELLGVYFAALTSAALDNKYQDKSTEGLSKHARDIFLDYCSASSNKVKNNKYIKKALKERDSNN